MPDGKETRDTVALAPRAYVVDAAVTPASLRLKGAARGAPRQLVHLRQEVLTYWNKETGIRLTVNERMIAHLLAYESAHLEEDQLLSEVLGVWDDSGPLLLLEAREPTAPSLNTPKR